MNLALFDFDGTITTHDTLVEFIKFSAGTKHYYLGLFQLSPILTAYLFKIIPNHKAKEKLISHFFKNMGESHFNSLANEYSLSQIDTIVRKKAMQRIQWHKDQGDTIVIVSASMEAWLSAWCEKNSLDLIGTKLEVQDNKLTGKFLTKNCHGKEKVSRVKERFNINDYKTIYAYGDSSGDKYLLELANHQYYKPFRS